MHSPTAHSSIPLPTPSSRLPGAFCLLGPKEPWRRGQIAGMVGLSVVHPIDTVKCRVQANVGKPGTPPVSAMAMASTLVRRDGLLALYRGIGAPMVAYGMINAVAFSTNTSVVRYLRGGDDFGVSARLTRGKGEGDDGAVTAAGRVGGGRGAAGGGSGDAAASEKKPLVSNPWLVGLIGGGTAGLTSSFVRGPAERVKTVQQVAESGCGRGGVPEKYRNTLRTAVSLARDHGILRGWFTGTGATIVREVPQCAVYFLTYDTIRRACESAVGAKYETAGIVLAGGSAGVVQWVVTYPLDVIKSRIQAFPPGTYNGMMDCAAKSLRAEGPLVFFRGIEMALLRAFPLHASIFLTCETIHGVLATFREEAEAEHRWQEKGGGEF